MIVLGLGEPGLRHARAHPGGRAAKAMARGDALTVLDGTAELRPPSSTSSSTTTGWTLRSNEITAGAGAKQILYNALMASVNPGDEVILPAPYWTSYADMVLIAGGVPVVVLPAPRPTAFASRPSSWRRPSRRARAGCSSTRPPTPAARPAALSSCAPVLEVVERHPQVWLLADDIYEHILYDGRAFATPCCRAARRCATAR